MVTECDLAIIGGGAAGFFAAINAAEKFPSKSILLIEGTRRLLTKVKVSGGGRCNVTHSNFVPRDLAENYPRGRRELLGPFSRFQPTDTIKWFEDRGVKLVTETDGRMFPDSHKSQTIIDCLTAAAAAASVTVIKGQLISRVRIASDGKFSIEGGGGEFRSDRLLLATGSVPLGYDIATQLGHQIIDPMPSLFTFGIDDPLLEELAGQVVDNVRLELAVSGKKFNGSGRLLVTHWGLSGPGVLRLSAFAARDLFLADYKANLKINFTGNLNQEQAYQQLKNSGGMSLADLKKPQFSFSKRFWMRFLELAGIGKNQFVTKNHLQTLASILTGCELKVTSKGKFKDEFVTSGGVSSREVNFKTMESRLCPGLYFAGEILNIDGVTGGYNFQNAWTTGWLAAENMFPMEPQDKPM